MLVRAYMKAVSSMRRLGLRRRRWERLGGMGGSWGALAGWGFASPDGVLSTGVMGTRLLRNRRFRVSTRPLVVL